MLIATLPAIYHYELLNTIISHPLVSSVRINTGTPSPHTAHETLAAIKAKTEKIIWVDLKCRQLRVERWCAPGYCEVELNHNIELELPAKIHFRGSEWADIKAVKYNKIYLTNPPRQAIGQGQSVNIHAKSLKINGYFTKEDLEYIKAAECLGIDHFMLSFYEGEEDFEMFEKQFEHPERVHVVAKIESQKGVESLNSFSPMAERSLMIARDDLLVNIGEDKTKLLDVLDQCLELDKDTIVASQFFSGLENDGVNASDISDLHLLHLMGYKNFMLSDGICHRHFHEAMKIWEQYLERKRK